MRAAGDYTDFLPAVDDRIAVPADAPIDHFEADQLPPRPLGLLPLQNFAAHEIAFLQLHDPAEVRLQRRRGMIDVIAVQRHFRLETQGVARAEAAGLDAAVDERAEHARTVLRLAVDLEAVFAGVTGARNDRRRAVHDSSGESVVLHGG